MPDNPFSFGTGKITAQPVHEMIWTYDDLTDKVLLNESTDREASYLMSSLNVGLILRTFSIIEKQSIFSTEKLLLSEMTWQSISRLACMIQHNLECNDLQNDCFAYRFNIGRYIYKTHEYIIIFNSLNNNA